MSQIALLVATLSCFLIGGAIADGSRSQVDWKTELLNKHNELRAKVANGQTTAKDGKQLPTAANMMKMTWDDSVAAGAQAWADKCEFKHDYSSNLGENLSYAGGMWSTGEVFDPKSKSQHVQGWFDEVNDYVGDIAKFSGSATDGDGKKIGHFTQVVWASSEKLGCGYKMCSNGGILVCRYAEGGNMLTAPIYKSGDTCSECTGTCSGGLCAK